MRPKTFLPCCRDRAAGIGNPFLSRCLVRDQFPAKRAAVEYEETKSLGTEKFVFTAPTIFFFSRRRAQPIAGERKCFSQFDHGAVARIKVAVEAKVSGFVR